MLSIIYSRSQLGIQAPLVTIEAHLSSGLPRFTIVGLPETVVRESKDRVRSALLNCHFQFPQSRITINLAPADIPKGGSRFDLPIAIAILSASGQLKTQGTRLEDHEFVGELALNGHTRKIPGVLTAIVAGQKSGRVPIIPAANAADAALIQQPVLLARHLGELVGYLAGKLELACSSPPKKPAQRRPISRSLAEIRGQLSAKRALCIAAAGGHSLLMTGPPGTGKTMLAERLPNLLPPLTEKDRLLVHAIYSVAGNVREPGFDRPFRAPHHTSSSTALIGGGHIPMPGEISLAHSGVLFLDELPEFNRRALEALREPLESGRVEIARANYKVEFPARFQLIAAMNPCPVGRNCKTDTEDCVCSLEKQRRYAARLSQPLLDRIDLRIAVETPPAEDMLRKMSDGDRNSEKALREKVLLARKRALKRRGRPNQELSVGDTQADCRLMPEDEVLMATAARRFGLSVRACHKTLRVARTIADLEASQTIRRAHLQEALGFRTDS